MKIELIKHQAKNGNKPTPILFIHGAWHGAWCWEEYFLPYFAARGYDAYALSLRGHGNSEGREGLRWWSISDYVDDVSQIIGQLPKVPVLVGHSMGGLIVQKYLQSQRVPAAVLLAPVPTTGVTMTTLSIAKRHFVILLKVFSTLSLYPVIGTPALAREAFFSENIPAAKLAAYYKKLQDESFRGFLDMTFCLPRPSKVRDPILLIGAMNDTIFSPRQMEATAKAYHTKAEMLSDTAHDIMLENRWQDAADIILNWLKGRQL
ncbi:MAG: alpha/beta fold hydrolase [Deltaproteobacteria bacterium]|nr:alpha/beta fold hydrolase [Deltaproteobacteria bacterium]